MSIGTRFWKSLPRLEVVGLDVVGVDVVGVGVGVDVGVDVSVGRYSSSSEF